MSAERALTWIVPGDPEQRTGGYRYDARIVEALRDDGWTVRVCGLEGRFPMADEHGRAALRDALAAVPDGGRVVIDGLAMGGLAGVVSAEARRLDLTALVHHPLADETGLSAPTRAWLHRSEAQALAAVRRVIVTSAFTAGRLRAFGVHPARVAVVPPGVDVPTASGDGWRPSNPAGQGLLCVGSVTPRKGHDVLLEALARLGDRDWHCGIVGDTGRDPVHARAMADAAVALGIADRVEWHGELTDAAVAAAYERAELLVVPSHYEGYGMVLTEGIVRGLPVIATDGGALAETVPAQAGLQVPAGDAAALAAALARWLDEPALRARLYRGAWRARGSLSGWPRAGAAFAAVLEGRPTGAQAESLS